jgi:hypothetical protein
MKTKWLVAAWLLFFSMQVAALELAGVKLDDVAQVGNAALKLNGAGIRTRLVFKVYVGALYLGERKRAAEAVLVDAGAKRVTLHMLRELSGEQLLEAFEKGMAANNTPSELAALDTHLRQLTAIFHSMKVAAKGDVILLDYLPGSGTRISVNAAEKGVIEGAEFNRALLRIWLGDKPVDEELKKGLLGG